MASPACGRVASRTTATFDIALYRLPPGFASAPHRHASVALVLGLDGQLDVDCAGRGLLRSTAGSGFHLHGDLRHRETSAAGGSCIVAQARDERPPAALPPGPALRLAALRAEAELLKGDDLAGEALEGLFLPLLAGDPRAESPRTMAARVAACRRRLDEDYVSPPGLRRLAGEAGVSPDHLARSFTATLGCSVAEYVRRVRVARASDLLRSTRATLADVALSCGFADQSHLTRQFRDALGVTPARFRRLVRS